MLPSIVGICLYPVYYAVIHNFRIPSGIEMTTVPCTTRCEVKFAASIEHHLVCEPSKDGDFTHISVTGVIWPKSDPSNTFTLERQSLDPKNRVFWKWPNRNDFTQINTEYEIALSLIKKSAGVSSSDEKTIPQSPFIVKLLPPPAPITPTPSE